MPHYDESHIEYLALRASGPGGQNVNKVETALQLFYNVSAAHHTPEVKERLIRLAGSRMRSDGVLILKAQRFRTRERNKADALERLDSFIERALIAPTYRKPTRATRASREERLSEKKIHQTTKSLRKKIDIDS